MAGSMGMDDMGFQSESCCQGGTLGGPPMVGEVNRSQTMKSCASKSMKKFNRFSYFLVWT